MDEATTGQLTTDAAEVYDRFFVPALFAEWAPRLADAVRLRPGDDVLDVACGTGAFAREAARRVAPRGRVVGVDRNEGMLAVARQKGDPVEWRNGRAEELPFPDRMFDAVGCQFGLMFFEDQTRALAEMWRVVRPGGRLVVAVWDALERSPGYVDMHALLHRLFGARASRPLEFPFSLGDAENLRALFGAARIPGVEVRTVQGQARFPSLDSWVYTDVRGWTLADVIDDEEYARLKQAAQTDLARFVQPDGTVTFRSPAHIAVAEKA